ncbi:MAG: hypothetical protein JW852_05655 [Spirochaetales bacterium]|nr:hypothetical protein [Spirochaetales bacterium]
MTKRSLSVLTVLFIMLCAQYGFAQSNELLDALLGEERATLGNATYLVFLAAGVAVDDWSVDKVVEELRSRDWGYEKADAQTEVDLGSLSFLIMKTFDMKGGIMYSLFPGRRYAAREFEYLGFVPGFAGPGRILTGQEVTHILGRALDYLGEREVTR